jgi:hypothetical protein
LGEEGALPRSAKQEVMAALKSYKQAAKQVGDLVDGVELGLDILATSIREGDLVLSVLLRTDAAASRQGFTQAMENLLEARRHLRAALLPFLQEDGVEEAAAGASLSVGPWSDRSCAARGMIVTRFR